MAQLNDARFALSPSEGLRKRKAGFSYSLTKRHKKKRSRGRAKKCAGIPVSGRNQSSVDVVVADQMQEDDVEDTNVERDGDGCPFVYVKNCRLINQKGEMCSILDLEQRGNFVYLTGDMSFHKEDWKSLKRTKSDTLMEWFGDNLDNASAAVGVKDDEINYIILTAAPEYQKYFLPVHNIVKMANYAVLGLGNEDKLDLTALYEAYFQQLGLDQAGRSSLLKNKHSLKRLVRSYCKDQNLLDPFTTYSAHCKMSNEIKDSRDEVSILRQKKFETEIVDLLYEKYFNNEKHTHVSFKQKVSLARSTFEKPATWSKSVFITWMENCSVLVIDNKRQMQIQKSDFVLFASDQEDYLLGQVQYFFQRGTLKYAHIQQFVDSSETMLGSLGSEMEIYEIHECANVPVGAIFEKLECEITLGSALPNTVSCRYETCLEYGFFQKFEEPTCTAEEVGGDFYCRCCKKEKLLLDFSSAIPVESAPKTFLFQGQNYSVGSFIRIAKDYSDTGNWHYRIPKIDIDWSSEEYISQRPELWRSTEGRKHIKCSPHPQGIGQILDIFYVDNQKTPFLQVSLLYRPEDYHLPNTRNYHPNLLFASNHEVTLKFDSDTVVGKAFVAYRGNIGDINEWVSRGPNRFVVHKYVEGDKFAPTALKTDTKCWLGDVDAQSGLPKEPPAWPTLKKRLKTLDMFCGAGGMSWGLQESGLAEICWGLDINHYHLKAFKSNFPDAEPLEVDVDTFIEALCHKEEGLFEYFKLKGIKPPIPGEVELICAGPPCQGFSLLNKFSHTDDSQDKRDCMVAFLSVVEIYKPKFLIMENVTSMLTADGGKYIQFVMRCLLELGYQCRVNNLQAADFGVPQSRQRVFVVGARHGEVLPEFPMATHCNSAKCSSAKINNIVIENLSLENGAPLREVYVGDVLADLPKKSGDCKYASVPFHPQAAKLRANCKAVREHGGKTLTPLLKAQLKYIPPGCNWNHLPNIKVKLEDGSTTEKIFYKKTKDGKQIMCPCQNGRLCKQEKLKRTLIPYTLAHTADTNSHWSNSFGRIRKKGLFSLSTTKLVLTRKQGTLIHPTEDRFLTVRELARSQMLPDSFKLRGTSDDKTTQVGNAVPPPFAFYIGMKIMESILENENK